MESSLTMIVHAVIIGIVLYLIMFYGLKQSQLQATDRSVLMGSLALVYMVLFGHELPNKINSNIY